MICRAEKVLAVMAHLDAAFARGRVTWSQVRGVVTAAGPLTVAQTTVLDQELAVDIDGVEVGHSEPDGLVRAAFHVAAQLACDQAEQAEADQIAHRNHLRMTLDEDGMAVAGHVDSEAGATLKAAVEAAARVSVPLCKCVVLIRRR